MTLVLDIAFAVLTFLVMCVGLVGAVVPVLPGGWLIWLAALAYGLLRPAFGHPLFDGWIGGIAIGLLTVLALLDLGLEFVVTHGVAHQEGVSFRAILASMAGGLLAMPLFPPLGSLAGSILGLFGVEYFRHGRNARQAWKSVTGYAKGCGWSLVAELGLCIVMMGIWIVWVLTAALL